MKTRYLIFFLSIASLIGVVDCYGQEGNITDSITITGTADTESLPSIAGQYSDKKNKPSLYIIDGVMIIPDSGRIDSGRRGLWQGDFIYRSEYGLPAKYSSQTGEK